MIIQITAGLFSQKFMGEQNSEGGAEAQVVGMRSIRQVKEKRTQKAQVENKIGISLCWTCEAKTKQVQMNQNNLLTMSGLNKNPNKKKIKCVKKIGLLSCSFQEKSRPSSPSLTHLVFVLYPSLTQTLEFAKLP